MGDLPSSMAETGHIYDWDASQNVTFPAGVSANTLTGSLDATNITQPNTLDIILDCGTSTVNI